MSGFQLILTFFGRKKKKNLQFAEYFLNVVSSCHRGGIHSGEAPAEPKSKQFSAVQKLF